MVKLNCSSISNFCKEPDNYILRQENSIIFAERKGISTWIKAHILSSQSYHFPKIIESLSEIRLNPSFIKILNRKIFHYNKAHSNKTELFIRTIGPNSQSWIQELICSIRQNIEQIPSNRSASLGKTSNLEEILEARCSKRLSNQFQRELFFPNVIKNLAIREFIESAVKTYNFCLGRPLNIQRTSHQERLQIEFFPLLKSALHRVFSSKYLPCQLKTERIAKDFFDSYYKKSKIDKEWDF